MKPLELQVKKYIKECISKSYVVDSRNSEELKLNDPDSSIIDYSHLLQICPENKWIRKFSENKNSPLDMINEFHTHKIVAEKIKNILLECIKSDDLEFLNELQIEGVIFPEANEEMKSILQMKGRTEMFKELTKVIYIKNVNWLGKLIYLLQNYDCDELKKFYPERYVSKKVKFSQDEAEVIANQYVKNEIKKLLNEDDDEIDDKTSSYVFTKEANKPSICSGDDSHVTQNDLDDLEDESEDDWDLDQPKEIELYKFQEELCRDAINGCNTIICSPTGSGKTIMAADIINKHLDANPEGRVAFIVNRVTLAIQQTKVFKQICGKQDRFVECLCSVTPKTGPIATYLPKFQILVMTGGTLCNGLFMEQDNPVKSLSEFSLIIFDECHHVINEYQYIAILRRYFIDKQKNDNAKLPQLVGLTASPRCKNENTLTGIKNSLYELVASLDCSKINIVKENVEEMYSFITIPSEYTIIVEPRSGDQFELKLRNLMESLEQKAMDILGCSETDKTGLSKICADKQNAIYNKFLRYIRLNADTSNKKLKDQLNSIYAFLKVAIEAFMFNRIINANFALDILKKSWYQNWKNLDSNYNQSIVKKFEEIDDESLIDNQAPNPALLEIYKNIRKVANENPDYRVIIFVKRVRIAFYIAEWLSVEKKINSAGLVSPRNLSKYNISKDSIEITMKQFRDGHYRVLVATTILEEGYDVPKCNLVISYCHASHETALIQRKGRARHKNSKYLLVLITMNSWMEGIEINNQNRWANMKKLIENFDENDPLEFKKRIFQIQRNKFLNPVHPNKKNNITLKINEWKIKHFCGYPLIDLSDLRKIQIHILAANPRIFSHISFIDQNKRVVSYRVDCKLGGHGYCCKCKSVVGNLYYLWDVEFFYIKPREIILEHCMGTKPDIRLERSWQKISPKMSELKKDSTEWLEYKKMLETFPLKWVQK